MRVLIIIACIMLFLASCYPMPYDYYILLRIWICGMCVFFFYKNNNINGFSFETGCYLVFAILYNPFVKISLDKNTWIVINCISVIFLIYTLFNRKHLFLEGYWKATKINDKDYCGNTPLANAIISHDKIAMKYLMDQKADIFVNNNKQKQLLDSISYGLTDDQVTYIIRNFIKNYKYINAGDLHNKTLLMYAVQRNVPIELISSLISAGANVNAKDDYNKTPLMYAIQADADLKILSLLICRGANVNTIDDREELSVFEYCCRYTSQPKLISMLTKAGVDIKAYDFIFLLHKCSNNQNIDVMMAIINEFKKVGFNIDEKDQEGSTPLLNLSSDAKDSAVIKALIIAGANVNVKDNKGRTPLMQACAFNRSYKIVKALINAGADINAKDNFNWSVTQIACHYSSKPQIIGVLIKAGCTITQEHIYDVLDYSISTSELIYKIAPLTTMIKYVLHKANNIEEKNKIATEILKKSRPEITKDIIKILLEAGMSINITD